MATELETRRRKARAIKSQAASSAKTVPERKAEHEKMVKKYDDTYLLCRDLRHAWERVGFWRNGVRINRKVICERCGTERIDVWTSRGIRERPVYLYAEDYKLAGDHLEMQEVRQEVMRRVTVFASEDSMIEAVFGNGNGHRKSRAS